MPATSTTCLGCGKPARAVWPSQRAQGKGRYCSRKCYTDGKRTELESLWDRCDKSGDCWPFMGGKRNHGYGAFHSHGKLYPAHRVAFELEYGPVPDGLYVCHTCDNPPCCNPEHLFLGTHGDNARDRQRKGRGNAPHGTSKWSAKLSEAQVRDIWSRTVILKHVRLQVAKEYGVAHAVIDRIFNGTGWKHITVPLFQALHRTE